MSQNKISIKVAGPAGGGVFTIGLLLSKYFQKLGLNVVYTTDYPSLIKGGHNTCSIRCEDNEIHSEVIYHDILVALDNLTIKEDLKYLNKGGILFIPQSIEYSNNDYNVIKIPYKNLLGDLDKRYSNTIAFGAVVGVISYEKEFISKAIRNHFAKKSDNVQHQNIIAAESGYEFSNKICEETRKCFKERIIKVENSKKTVFMSGNDASALGALKAGVKFVGEYPMTPSSSFLSFFAAHELDYNITTKHTEDELAAMNMTIGAAITGVRAMTATSGGGFALMNEALGFAGISEAPLVCFECQRAGPSTGIPTYTDQGDLKFVLNSSQGEFPLVVLAPGDITESFELGFEAFNIAEQVQTPVIVLLDKHLAASHWTAPRFDTSKLKVNREKYIPLNDNKTLENYKRHEFTEDGVSPRCVPGQKGGIHVASSYEHDETGWTCEDGNNHVKMQKKRFNKLNLISKELLKPKIFGPENADLTIVGWGSTKGPVIDAIKYLNNDGYKVNYMHFIFMNPMDDKVVKNMLDKCNDTIILEGNATAQLRGIIRERTGFYIEKTYLKYDGRPYYMQDIYNEIKKIMEDKRE